MTKLLEALAGLVSRFTSRSFIVTIVVLYFVATHPEISVEQLVGLLVGAGVITARAIAEDRVPQ